MQTELFKGLIENTRADKSGREGIIIVNYLILESVDINLAVLCRNKADMQSVF